MKVTASSFYYLNSTSFLMGSSIFELTNFGTEDFLGLQMKPGPEDCLGLIQMGDWCGSACADT